MYDLILLVLTGLGVGVISSFFGIGGGLLAIPALYTMYPNIPSQTVVGCSLGMIFINSMLNSYNFIKSGKKPILKLILSLGLFSILGVFTGGQLTLRLDSQTVKYVFGVTIVLVVLRLLIFERKYPDQEQWESNLKSNFYLKAAIVGIFGGVVAGLTGLGGGLVMIPLLIAILKLPYHSISFYSNCTMIFSAAVGALTYMLADNPFGTGGYPSLAPYQIGHVNLLIIPAILFGSFFTSKLGVYLNGRASAQTIKYSFVALLTLVALKIFLT